MTDTVDATTSTPRTRSGLDSKLLPELKQLGASLGVKGANSMRKGDLGHPCGSGDKLQGSS